MRRLRQCVAGLLATGAVAPTVATAQAPAEDSVAAQGGFVGVVTFDIDVRSGPSGEQPTGAVSFHLGGGLGPSYSAEVSCLAVSGSTAVLGFVGTRYFFGEIEPVGGLIRVVDGADLVRVRTASRGRWPRTRAPGQPRAELLGLPRRRVRLQRIPRRGHRGH